MKLIGNIETSLWKEYTSYRNVQFYIDKWHKTEELALGGIWENFIIAKTKEDKIDLPQTEVVIISPKPSIARWHLAPKYNRLNRKFSRYCNKNSNLEFANVWNVMLDKDGMVFQDIFLEDGLHMNKKGYDLWAGLLREYLK